MIHKNILFCILFLVSLLGSSHSETHNWAVNLKLPYSSNFTGISKADSLNIMACANFETYPSFRQIIKTTNGGITWKMVYNFNDNNLGWFEVQNICYPTKNFCIASCDSNYFLKTTDGGETWVQFQIKMDLFTNGLIHISLLDSLNGIMGTYRNIAFSDDGFKTYKILKLPRPLVIGDIKLVSSTKLYLLADSPISFFQYDIKEDLWTEYPESFPKYDPEYRTPNGMFFSDSLFGYVTGNRRADIGDASYDMIHKTTDCGKTWVEKFNALVSPRGGLTEVDFCDKENGIAAGPQGKIFWTHDAGETWSQDSTQALIKATPAVMHVAKINKSTALIADFSGNMWRTPIGTDIPKVNDDESMIYPNPATDFIEISVGTQLAVSDQSDVRIYNVLGEIQTTPSLRDTPPWKGVEKVRINVSSLAPGMYFVRIGDRVSKFVKL